MRFCSRCGSRYEHERFCPEDGSATEPLEVSAPAEDPLINTLVDGRYRILGKIGEGGMGVVYKATHVAINKTLALKLLRVEVASEPDVVQRFIQEAQAATSIGHENIVDISDFGQLKDGTAYFVMEFLNGRALSELIRRGGSIPTGDAVQILRQIASALGAAHRRGIVHRDLKPDNVMVLARGEFSNFVKVLDFGIAKVGGTKNKLTRTGMVFGTPHYMSPEQAAGQSVDARTDIYALGVIMYEMFTGRVPFDGDTFMGVLTKHMFEKPAPMFGAGIERQLGAVEQITLRALEKKPENRYASMDELIEDLDRVLGGGAPRTIAGQRPSAELADALEPRSNSELRLEQRQKLAAETVPELPTRSPIWPYFAGAAALGTIVLIGVLVFRSKPEPSRVVAPIVPTAPPVAASATAPSSEKPSAPEPAQLSPTITIASEPSGAELIIDGAIIGRTPATLARPSQGERTFELRLAGHQREPLRVHADSPSTLTIALRKQAVATPAKKKLAAPSEAKPAPTQGTRKRMNSEVVDPWAD
jgi:eukaryotic-like serine/threonine-protein kinase